MKNNPTDHKPSGTQDEGGSMRYPSSKMYKLAEKVVKIGFPYWDQQEYMEFDFGNLAWLMFEFWDCMNKEQEPIALGQPTDANQQREENEMTDSVKLDQQANGIEFFEFNKTGDTCFFVNENIEVLRIKSNGDFLVKGIKITNDMEVYTAMCEFLKGTGYLKKSHPERERGIDV